MNLASAFRKPWVQGATLALLCVASFASGLGGGFVMDDGYAIVHHPVVQGTAPLLDAFKLSFWGEPLTSIPPSYRPVATLSFALDHRLFGGSAPAFHVTSLLCYVALVLAGWRFARRCMSAGAAWLALALFAVMPTHAENVASLVGRADTLAVLFAALTLLALSPTVVDGAPTSVARLLAAALAFAVGLLAKETIAVLPLVVALFAELRRRRPDPPLPALRAHAPTATLTAVLIAYVALRLSIQPGALSYTAPSDVVAGADLWQKAAYGVELLARYARLVAVPVNLCTGRTFAEVSRPTGPSVALVVGCGLLAIAGLATWRSSRRREIPFAAAAIAAWLLVTGVVFPMPESMADRFLLLPSFFLCLALGPWLSAAWRRAAWMRALLVLALGAQIALSDAQAATWSDEGHLLAHAVRACPSSIHNHFRYAEYLSQHGRVDEAVWHYAVFTSGRHAFPYEWTHPAAQEERTVPIDDRLRDMHRLLRFSLDEATWRARFVAYLRGMGRRREAQFVAGLPSSDR
ncbi:MAG TPA: glycosyltransferase family 39 protein [Polyangia bacterium]|nr:glycosyltransferase family 39 protein [Polyangia bacterium]